MHIEQSKTLFLLCFFYATANCWDYCQRVTSPSRIYNLSSERREGDIGQFEMLLAEGDADDGDVEEQSEEDMGEPDPHASHEEPDDVHQGVEASTGGLLHDLRAKGPQGKHAQFQRLQSEGDADDGDHHRQTAYDILEGDLYAAEYEPNDISKEFHTWGQR